MDRQEQQERMRDAFDRKNEEARAASEASIDAPSRSRDPVDPRTKSTGHGKKTADKWNQ